MPKPNALLVPKSGAINPIDFEFFRKHGFVVLPDAISPADLADLRAIFDRDYNDNSYLWRPFGDQLVNCDSLASSPDIDRAIRHPKILPVIGDLMGGPVVFSEICLRHMKPYDGETRQSWHRDRPHWLKHPLRMDYIQLMIYLTDVDEHSHCFSISPESCDDPILQQAAQFARAGKLDLHGRAGTAALFNVSVLHSATLRKSTRERKTIQIYYGHASRPHLSNDSIIPAAFWYCNPDAQTRAFYGKLNLKTRMFLRGSGCV